MAVPNDKEAVVEEKPDEKPHDLTLRALEQRIRQQEIMSELGVMALQGPPFETLLADLPCAPASPSFPTTLKTRNASVPPTCWSSTASKGQ